MSLNIILILCGLALLFQTALLYFRGPLMEIIAKYPESVRIIAIVFTFLLFACAILPIIFYLAS